VRRDRGRSRDAGFAEIGFHESPARLLLVGFFTGGPLDGFLTFRPRPGILLVELGERERGLAPAGFVPSLEHRMDGGADVERGRLGLHQPGNVAKSELQPALQEQRQPGWRHCSLQAGDDLGCAGSPSRRRRFGEGDHARAPSRFCQRGRLRLIFLPTFSSRSSIRLDACILFISLTPRPKSCWAMVSMSALSSR